MSRPCPRSLAVAIAAVSVGLSGLSSGEAAAVPPFRSGQDVALRDTSRARSHASPAPAPPAPADPPDTATAHGTYTQYFRVASVVPDASVATAAPVSKINLPGYLRIYVSTGGQFTGKLFLGGRLISPLSGVLGTDIDLAASFNDDRGGEVDYTLTLSLDLVEDASFLKGVLEMTQTSDPTKTGKADLHVKPRRFDAGHVGNYTLALPPDLDGAPHPTRYQPAKVSSLSPLAKRPAAIGGCGYGLLRVNNHGALHAVAVLADGQKVGFGGYFDPTATVAVFSQLYTSGSRPPTDERDIHGYIGGVFRFRDRPHRSDALALLQWVRPSACNRRGGAFTGFSVIQPALVSLYTRHDHNLSILDGVHTEKRETEIALVDGGLPHSIESKGAVEADKVNGNRPDLFANFSTDYGYFRGHFDHPGPHASVDLRGVVLQKQGRAYGQFFDSIGRSGSVVIKQKPKATPVPAAAP